MIYIYEQIHYKLKIGMKMFGLALGTLEPGEGLQPHPHAFPCRNTIITSLQFIVVTIEAGSFRFLETILPGPSHTLRSVYIRATNLEILFYIPSRRHLNLEITNSHFNSDTDWQILSQCYQIIISNLFLSMQYYIYSSFIPTSSKTHKQTKSTKETESYEWRNELYKNNVENAVPNLQIVYVQFSQESLQFMSISIPDVHLVDTPLFLLLLFYYY